MATGARFRDRADAGRQLARALPADLKDSGALVLALPRGGVPVAYEFARALGFTLDILMVRKLGLPGRAEYAMGAVGSNEVCITQPEVLRACGITSAELGTAIAREQAVLAQREHQFRGSRPAPDIAGRTVILVDDGLATGSTMRAAIAVARQEGAAHIVVAVPVGAPDTCYVLAGEVDHLVCLHQPTPFIAVGKWYQQFSQTKDEEVQALLASVWRNHNSK
jgi:putative phosphoribosyl transferase